MKRVMALGKQGNGRFFVKKIKATERFWPKLFDNFDKNVKFSFWPLVLFAKLWKIIQRTNSGLTFFKSWEQGDIKTYLNLSNRCIFHLLILPQKVSTFLWDALYIHPLYNVHLTGGPNSLFSNDNWIWMITE